MSHSDYKDFVVVFEVDDIEGESPEHYTANPSRRRATVLRERSYPGDSVLDVADEFLTQAWRGRVIVVDCRKELFPGFRQQWKVRHYGRF